LYAAARDLVVMGVRGEASGLATVRVIWQGGPLNWLGLAALGLGIAATVYLVLHGQALPHLQAELWEGEVVAAPAGALGPSLLLFAIGWAYLIVGSLALGLGAYVMVAAYATYYCLPVGFGLQGTPWMALLPIWLLFLGGRLASSRPGRWRLPLLGALSLLVGMFLYPVVRLKALVPLPWGFFVMGGLCLAVVANPWALRPRPLRPAMAFGGSLAVLVALFVAALVQSPSEEVFGNAFLAIHDLLGSVALFWYWMGLDLFGGARGLANWVAGALKALLPERALALGIWGLWMLWGACAYGVVHRPVPPLVLIQFLLHYDWGRTFLQAYAASWPSDPLMWTLDYHLYLTLAIIALAVTLALFRRLMTHRLLGLLGLFVFSFLCIYSYFGLAHSFQRDETGSALGFWPLVAFVGGMSWQVLKAGSSLAAGERWRPWLFEGFLVVFGGISLLELAAGYRIFEEELSLNTYLGALYLGLPYLLYTYVYERQHHARIRPRQLLLLFGLGLVSAIPCLVWGHIIVAPLLWWPAVVVALWRQGGEGERWDGLVAGVTLALGFVVFYARPVLIPVPVFVGLVRRFMEAQIRYTANVIWPWEGRWWWILLAALGAAAIQGLLLGQARVSQGWRRSLWLALGLVLSVGLLAACESALEVV